MYNYVRQLVTTTLAILVNQDTQTWGKTVVTLIAFTGVYLLTQSKAQAGMEKKMHLITFR